MKTKLFLMCVMAAIAAYSGAAKLLLMKGAFISRVQFKKWTALLQGRDNAFCWSER